MHDTSGNQARHYCILGIISAQLFALSGNLAAGRAINLQALSSYYELPVNQFAVSNALLHTEYARYVVSITSSTHGTWTRTM